MKRMVEIHTCDICGKDNNLGDKYESGESVLTLKGHRGSNHSNGGYSFDKSYDLCLSCTKMIQEYIASLNPINS